MTNLLQSLKSVRSSLTILWVCFLRLQDLSSGYWVLVVHFTRREAIKQIEVLQHVATNLGRSEYLTLHLLGQLCGR